MIARMTTSDGGSTSIDALLAAITGARVQLESHVREINDLNVFPVADGDTGTNLLQSVQAIERSAQGLVGTSFADRCEMIARAALLGARGNSGMILSQMVRGAADAIADAGRVDAGSARVAFRGASDTAYGAVRNPVEGTMLTVIRGLADGAEASAATSLDDLLIDAIAAGESTLAATQEMLPQLKEAGVVDSGAYGVLLLVEGLAAAIAGRDLASTATQVAAPTILPEQHEPSAFRYCTTFIIEDATTPLERLEDQLAQLGDSLLVMGDSRQAKVHVHTDDPPRAIALGETIGLVSGVNIDDMHRQEEARAQRIERSMRAARGEVTGSVDRTIALTDANTALITDSTADLPDAMRAVNMRIVPVPVSFGTEAFDVSSAGNNAAFYERLATGGQNATTAAPSMGDLVDQYRQALESYEFAIVLHMSTTFSSTADVARRAALEVDPDRIFVIETESVSYQLALIVSRVQAALVRGTTLGDVEDLVDEFRRTQAMAFSLASLEYIQRGGRISKGRALVGNLLGVRPILQIAGGEIEQYSKIRGADRMMPGLRDFVVERTRDDIPLRVSVAHAVAPALIADLTALIAEARPNATIDLICDIGPVVGTHAGPGAVGVACFHDPTDQA
jgi:DAK2 domain fusion protein YloV